MVRPPTGSVSGKGQLGEGEKLKLLKVISRGIYHEKYNGHWGGALVMAPWEHMKNEDGKRGIGKEKIALKSGKN